MTIEGRAYDDRIDRSGFEALFESFRAATGTSTYPTYWRLRLLISSRLVQPDLDSQVWLDASGKLTGLALLWSRAPDDGYRSLERVLEPAEFQQINAAMIEWATRRTSMISNALSKPITLYVTCLPSPLQSTQDLKAAGFAEVDPDPAAHNVYYLRDLSVPISAQKIPNGFRISSLFHQADVTRYEAVYDFAPVAQEHRQQLLRSSEYRHIVLTDRNGCVVSYCECSVWMREWGHKSPKTGWIDYVGTVEKYRRQGFAEVVLSAALGVLRDWGAEQAMLITSSSNRPANALFTSAGFSTVPAVQPMIFQRRFSFNHPHDHAM